MSDTLSRLDVRRNAPADTSLSTWWGRLKAERVRLGLTQAQVAERVNDLGITAYMSQGEYSILESGKRPGAAGTKLKALAEGIGRNVDWLLGFTGSTEDLKELLREAREIIDTAHMANRPSYEAHPWHERRREWLARVAEVTR